MIYVLDTNVISALMRGDPKTTRRLRQQRSADVGVPQPLLAELSFGVQRMPASKRKSEFEARLELIRVELNRLDWTDEVSDAFGRIKTALERSGQVIEDFDVAIAAHALALDGTLVSSNAKHMRRIKGLRLEDWHA